MRLLDKDIAAVSQLINVAWLLLPAACPGDNYFYGAADTLVLGWKLETGFA
jgi:hypothetical protein